MPNLGSLPRTPQTSKGGNLRHPAVSDLDGLIGNPHDFHRGLAQTPALWGLRFREAKLPEAMAEAQSRFAAANLPDIILRMSAPASGSPWGFLLSSPIALHTLAVRQPASLPAVVICIR